VNAADHRLEARRQVSDEIEDHLLSAADHECMSKVYDSDTLVGHAAWAL
jgi:hypothetical protein